MSSPAGKFRKMFIITNLTNIFSAGCTGKLQLTRGGGPGVSPKTVRWGGTLLPKAIGRAMEWPATTATAASGGCRELLLGPRPARRKRKRCECWEPQPVLRFGTQRLRTADAAITEYHSKLQKTIKNSKKAALSALQQALSAASFALIG